MPVRSLVKLSGRVVFGRALDDGDAAVADDLSYDGAVEAEPLHFP